MLVNVPSDYATTWHLLVECGFLLENVDSTPKLSSENFTKARCELGIEDGMIAWVFELARVCCLVHGTGPLECFVWTV